MTRPVFEIKKGSISRLRTTIDKKIIHGVVGDAPKALRSVGELIGTEAQRETPVDTGVLRASKLVTGPKKVRKDWEVRISFGGAAAPYAVHVHENLSAQHTVGRSKYLESVVLQHDVPREVAAYLK